MKKVNTYLLITVFLATALFFACKKDQPEMRQAEDPCKCASEVSAEFDILEQNNISSVFLTKTDHILAYRNAHFRAKEENAKYTWFIGSEVLHEKEIYRYFGEEWKGHTIPITLVVEKEPNLTCFPDDNGYDTITKYMNVYNRCHPHMIDGDFMVAEKNSTDSMVIGLQYNEYPPFYECYNFDIINYDGQGSVCAGEYVGFYKNHRAIKSGSSTPFDEGCQMVSIDKAEITLENRFELELRYRVDNGGPTLKVINKEYYGRKIP